jgi:hypothetical protein
MIDWRVGEDGSKIVFFEIQNGGELFIMDAGRFGWLLNGDYVRGLLQAVVEERTYPAEWGLEKFVEAQRLLKGDLNMTQIAELWDTTDASVRAFYNRASQKFAHAQDLIRQEWAQQAKGDGIYVELVSPRPADYKFGSEVQTHIMLNISRVAEMLKANGNNYREVWQEFGVKSDAFSRWLDANQKVLAILGVVL